MTMVLAMGWAMGSWFTALESAKVKTGTGSDAAGKHESPAQIDPDSLQFLDFQRPSAEELRFHSAFHDDLYQAIFKAKNYSELIDRLEHFLNSRPLLHQNGRQLNRPIPIEIKCRLALARAHYRLGQNEQADAELEKLYLLSEEPIVLQNQRVEQELEMNLPSANE